MDCRLQAVVPSVLALVTNDNNGIGLPAMPSLPSGLSWLARGRLSRSLIRLLWPCTGHHARYSAANGHVR